jgi:hypothetical protein
MMIPTDAMTALLDDSASATAIRALLIHIDTPSNELIDEMIDDTDAMPIADAFHNIDALRATCRDLLDDPHNRETLTDIALALSLCPMHLIDYAICFDDDDAECAAIRIIHPSHDT